jgi:Holliday junction resolvase
MGFRKAGGTAPDSPGNGPLDVHSLAACCNLPNSGAGPAAQARKRGGRASRQKGDRLERAVVKLLQDAGLGAERIPLSGSAGGSFSGDISVPVCNRDLILEAKSRARGFSQIYAWLQNSDALIVKSDRHDAIVILPLKLAAEIALAAERGKT